jgi:hypothetical protein
VYARQVLLVGDNFLSCEAYYLAGKCLNQHRREAPGITRPFELLRDSQYYYFTVVKDGYAAENTKVDLSNREFLLSD